ncbi:uncharacterized protein LOC110029614 isoform X2 [Phalaenopsis equestris]|uniref:uncharacterized protein LOC110029614 isoform X2 n=1 Tax=Phalaenopsis equestris TaxID=78828 RepID=UPI0009E65453|nr:uncharacterized protein LOC110029614 isoform X2 [Phalaenopsis equestris]
MALPVQFFSPLSYPPCRPFISLRRFTTLKLTAIGPDGKFRPLSSDEDPPEAPEDSSHGVSRMEQFRIQVAAARRRQEEQFEKDKHRFVSAFALEEDPPSNSDADSQSSSGDDPFVDIDRAIALKRQEFVKQGLLPPNPPKNENKVPPLDSIDELLPEEVIDLEEIEELHGLTLISNDEVHEDHPIKMAEKEEKADDVVSSSSSFELDLESLGKSKSQILEPKFRMTLAELLDESRIVPLSVYGNLDVLIAGIQHDPREVSSGDLFICCDRGSADGQDYLTEADKRGAVAVVADKVINLDETIGCKALVVVEETDFVLPVLAASFFRNPSRTLSVIGVTGTRGKTSTSFLIKAMYEAMGLRTGMMGSLGHYIHGDNKLEASDSTPDAVTAQKLMAKMVHNGTEAVILEASSYGLAEGRCDEVDFDIAVFTNLTRDLHGFNGTEEQYRNSMAKLFERMIDPERHRKVVNIDDPNASYFISKGNPNVPVVTYAMEDKNAAVYPLKFELSLFETQVLIQTPIGILEISSGLLGRHNISNILAAVAVGIAVGSPLEDIVRGIEEVDAVPGRCELIDEEQAFGVIVDHARTPDAFSRLLDTARELGPRRIITGFSYMIFGE